MARKTLTTEHGVPVADNRNFPAAGQRGPVLFQDIHLIGKLAHFNRKRIPGRMVHARGAGAHRYFQIFKGMHKIIRNQEVTL